MTVDQMIAGYKQGHSLRRISADAGLSYQKCRKILITAGVYSSPKADRINELAAAGLTKDQISEQLKIKPETVEAYLGYKKGAYNSDEPTVNALRIRKCRDKKRAREG